MADTTSTIDWNQIKQRVHDNAQALEEIFSPNLEKNKLIFQQRAQRMAARVLDLKQENSLLVMSFEIGKERYCLPVADLSEVIPYANCTPIPGSPKALKGAMSIHGEIRCIIDLSAILGLSLQTDEEEQGYILLLRQVHQGIGLKVGHVHQVQSIKRSLSTKMDSASIKSHTMGSYAKSIDCEALILLDLDKVLEHSIFYDAI